MSMDFSKAHVRAAVAKILLGVGWSTSDLTPLEVLTDICVEHLVTLARLTNRNANEYNSSCPSVRHLEMAMDVMSVKVEELNEYVARYGRNEKGTDVPRYPVARNDNLNFLKPGSAEVLTRPLHIFDYLPPIPRNSALDVRKCSSKIECKVNAARSMASIMMTRTGFISSSKRGILPTIKLCKKSKRRHKSSKKVRKIKSSGLSIGGTTKDRHLDANCTKRTPKKRTCPKINFLKEIKREIRDLFKSDSPQKPNETSTTLSRAIESNPPSTSKLSPELNSGEIPSNLYQSAFSVEYDKILSTLMTPSEAKKSKCSPCPGCSKEDDGSLMIACDVCDTWYHFRCAEIESTFNLNCDDWFCKSCVLEYGIVKPKTQ